ncbi:MAG: lamin tail domain-containing protein, partial [Kiritimatiellia bacterium]|nr:lamin tail domain-containing protein [Kiritimatiellia bacterium]
MTNENRFSCLLFVGIILLAVASFVHAAGDSVVVFNEVMYHPATNEASLEWVELHNQMAVDVDISSWRLRSGISYDFPTNTIMPGGGYIVVARDPSAVEAAHGITGIFGPFDGRLSNAGENLRLRNHDGRIMDELDYNDRGHWPIAPDGSGVSLAKIEEDMGTADPANWAQSLSAGGTPGAANTIYQTGSPSTLGFNEIAGATNTSFWVELVNTATTNIDVGGYRVAVSGFSDNSYTLPSQILLPGTFLTLYDSTMGFDAYDEDKLFLYAPSDAVIDAKLVQNSARAKYPDGIGDWLRPSATTPGTTNEVTLARDIVINEIMYHHQQGSAAESDEEWIELYNRGAAAVDLSGWELDEAVSFTFPSNTFLGAGKFLVVADNTNTLMAAFPGLTNIVGEYSGNLANAGEEILLLDAGGNPADEVRYYDGYPWPDSADGNGSSLELRDADADNSVAAAWDGSDETTKSAWQTITYRGVATADGIGHDIWHEFCICLLGPGEVLLDDISVVEDPDGGAVAFMQNGTFESDSLGSLPDKWRLLGTHGSHGRSVVVDDPVSPGNRVLHLVSTGDYKHEHNHAETTFASSEQVVAGREYEISFRAKWLTGSPQVNTRLYFNWLQRTTVLDTPQTNGTPGRINSRVAANLGPTYSDLAHTPVVPANGQSVEVSVVAADPDAVDRLWVMYAVSGGTWQSNLMVSASGGKFTGTIPGQSSSALVQFYVFGSDDLGASSTWPADGASSRAMYRVEDGQANLATVHNLRVVMTSSDRDAMYIETERMSNYRRRGTAIYDERLVYYDVGIRLKGSSYGRTHDSETGLNVEFPADRLFRGVHSTISIERGGSRREIVAKHMFSAAGGGLASLYDDAARVIMPRSSDTGRALFSMARYTDVFLDAWLENGSDGNDFNHELLYTPTGTVDGNPESLKKNYPYTHSSGSLDLDDYGSDKETYRWNFQLRNNRRRDEYSGMLNVCQAFSLSGDNLDIASRDVLDVSQWMRTFAMQSLVGNDDTYSRLWRHNFRMIERPSDGRILAMPWDLDRSFNLSTSAALWGGDNVRNLIELPGSRRLFYGHALDMITTTCNTTYMAHWTSHYGTLLGENFSGRLSWIGSRSAYFLGQLPTDHTTFTVTNTSFTVAGDTAVIGGQAGIAIEEIYLDGLDTPLDTWWTSAGSGTAQTFFWQTTVPVAPGGNFLTFEAYGFQGELVGSDSVAVTSTASDRPLFDYLRVTELMYNPAGSDEGEFIELHNHGAITLDLTSLALSDGVTFNFADGGVTNLPPGAYVLAVRDLAGFAARYDTNALLVAGEYSGSLANGGELVTLAGPYDEEIISFTYNDNRDWPLAADGAGHALVPLSPDGQDTGTLDYGRNWRAGTYIYGSPGASDPVRAATVVLNEIMAHTDYTNGPAWQDSNDWIELYNGGTTTVTLADWYLSDDVDELQKWEIPATIAMTSFTWRTFYEVLDFHTNETSGFGLNKDGEQVFLSHLPGTSEDRVVDAIAFKGQENGSSFGRYADGDQYWYRLSPTTNSANALPGGDLVIDEIMYNAANGGSENPTNEFVELFNPLGVAVQMWNASGNWRLAGGVDFDLPSNTVLAAGERLVIVSFEPTNAAAMAEFSNAYDPPGGAAIIGPYQGRLSNKDDRVAIERPQASDDPLRPWDISWVVVDETTYFDRSPWPSEADGTGRPLQRLLTDRAGNDPTAWIVGGAASPGAPPHKLIITAPADGQAFLVPFTTTVSVAVQSEFVSGPVQRVSLQLNGSEIASTNASPYTFPLSGISTVSTNMLKALLVDNSGTNESPVVTIHAYTNTPFAEAGRDLYANVSVNGTVPLAGDLDASSFPPGDIATVWSLDNGPAPVDFGDAGALETTATFTVPGVYSLTLTTTYNGVSLDDTVTVTVTATNSPNHLPYAESFEYYATGQDLNGIHGWSGAAVVENNATPHDHGG